MKRKVRIQCEVLGDSAVARQEADVAVCAEELLPDTPLASSTPGDDYRLAERCLAGEVAAWEELYGMCHEPLCLSIKFMLCATGRDPNLVDEMAARVWYALVAKDGALLARYSPKRGARLITFLQSLAKDQISRHFRSEHRRSQRERTAVRERHTSGGFESEYSASDLNEFLATLTPQEYRFCCEILLADENTGGKRSRSKPNVWQLTHRVYQKLCGFLGRQV